MILINHQNELIDLNEVNVQNGINKDKWSELWLIIISLRSNGSDAVIVYIIMYIPACIRSGWYPQPRIKNRVGINETSNEI